MRSWSLFGSKKLGSFQTLAKGFSSSSCGSLRTESIAETRHQRLALEQRHHRNAASATGTPYRVEGTILWHLTLQLKVSAHEAATKLPLTPEKEPAAEEEPAEKVAKRLPWVDKG